ncbi:VIT1/CCC1 family protein [Candidatus Bathyarchaeota archaeon]|nr:VIT1/CCC1 family protein [Candidatus Bathyarchaeota archaeon]
MEISSNLKKVLINTQEKEITEHIIYKRLAKKTKGKNIKILTKISNDELHHYNQWKEYTQSNVQPNKFKVIKYVIIAKIFGLMFMMKLLEGNEEKAQINYSSISKQLPITNKIIAEELEHEKLLIEMIDEKRLNYLSSIITGLNDAMIELAGELAGFTFALQNPALIGFAGLIAGVAQFLSSSASEIELYLTERTIENKNAIRKSFFEGTIYLVTVFFLVIPFFLVKDPFLAMGISAFNSLLIIIFLTYYVSVVKELSLKKMFSITLAITLGIGILSFIIGWIVKTVLNL